MVQYQLVNKVLATQDLSILINNNLTNDYFPEYLDEISYIRNHNDEYGNVPDTVTFLEKFPEFKLMEVAESDRYLVDAIREEKLYADTVPVIKKSAEFLKSDANAAVQYLLNQIVTLQPNYSTPSVDIIHDKTRLDEFKEKSEQKIHFTIPTGFEEIDNAIGGWERGEELIVIFARTNQCKSWVMAKSLQHAWKVGYNVAYISPEMSPTKLGYRFDTLNKNLSNLALMRGDVSTITVEEYNEYLTELETHENKFLVSTPANFNKEITVGKLRSYIKENNLDMLAIDGITYMTDERYKRGDNKTTSLTNISEDLMELSIELKVPILVVVQSNREGINKDDKNATPELENIRDSDGISHNASRVFAVRKKESNVIITNKKNRYGRVGDTFNYYWDIDKGQLEYMPCETDAVPIAVKEEKVKQIRENAERGNRIVF